MSRLFLGNFEFEHELAGRTPDHGVSGSRVRQAVRGLAAAWVAIAEPEDMILTPDPVLPGDLEELESLGRRLPRFVPFDSGRRAEVTGRLVPWGCSPSMIELARERSWSTSLPHPDVVRQVNSRRERFDLEQSLGVALPGMQLVESIDELERTVAASGDAQRGWILKANFGMAGRESVRGRGTILSDPIRGWARTRLEQAGCVLFEPLVAPIAEAGIQLEIPPEGSPTLVGIAPQIIGPGGTYRGSRFGSRADEIAPWQNAVPVARMVASHLQRLGYFGPLGIDAMWYRDADGQAHLRPLQDLNARFTMGRLALGWSRWLPAGWCGSWFPTTRAASESLTGDPSQARVLATFPNSWRTELAGATLILAASSTIRAEVERQILQRNRPAD